MKKKLLPFSDRLTAAQKYQWQIFQSVGAGVRSQIIGAWTFHQTMAQSAPASVAGVAKTGRTSKKMA